MKRWPLFFAALFLLTAAPLVLKAQGSIPNPGFEQWTSGDPDGWLTSNVPSTILNVTQSADAHSGSSAARGEVVDFSGFAIQPYLIASTAGEAGIPISERWATVRGFYKMSPDSGDKFLVDVVFSKASNPVAGGGFIDSNTVSAYQEFVVNMFYFSSEVPDTAFITITVVGPNGGDYHTGSVIYVDDISLSGVATSVEEQPKNRPVELGLQNYPNPFNATTTISYALPQRSAVRLEVFNLLGQPVRSWALGEQAAGRHTVAWDGTDDNGKPLSSGVYFYRLQGKNFTQANKMLLLK